MPRLIDADELLKHAYDSGAWKDAETGFHQRVVDIEDIDDAPTVDAVEVVRCKDCKFANECQLYLGTGELNGYCMQGERREDAKTN